MFFDSPNSSNPTQHLSVAGLLFFSTDLVSDPDLSSTSFLFGLRHETGSMGGRWELPGGKVEDEETLEEALLRECEEEMKLRPTILRSLNYAEFRHKEKDFRVYGYLARLPFVPQSYPEHQMIGWFTLSEALTLVLVDSDRDLIRGILEEPYSQGL